MIGVLLFSAWVILAFGGLFLIGRRFKGQVEEREVE